MAEPKIVPQKEYATLEEFVEGQNNFWHFFIEDSYIGDLYRTHTPAYSRFVERNPDFAKELTAKTTAHANESEAAYAPIFEAIMDAQRAGKPAPSLPKPVLQNELPGEDLFCAYKLMAQLVYEDDEFVRRKDGTIDDGYLCR